MKNSKRAVLACLASLLCFSGCGDNDSMPSEPIVGECGNGVIEKGEVCDDHNTNDGDGCNSTCTSIELGYTCPTEGAPCVSNKKDDGECGNGIIDGLERCDDSNTNGDDGCSADCMTIEPGYKCPEEGKPCQKTESTPDCGNGMLEYGEECDDGNMSSFDGCSNECTLEEGYECPEPNQPCTPILVEECGDYNLTENEECDDGNTEDNDGCSATCQIEPGYTCDSISCTKNCGNGNVDQDEECDQKITVSYDKDYPLLTTERKCTDECTFAPYCGDGIHQAGEEECDAGENAVEYDTAYTPNGSTERKCTANCTFAPYCGDGEFSPGFEKCDPSVTGGNEGCNADCTPKEGYACSAQDGTCIILSTIKCGDGKIEGNEECDQTGNGCNNCQHDAAYKCIGSLTAPCTVCTGTQSNSNYPCCTNKAGEQCREIAKGYGDGVLDPDGNEECDDGNKQNGDGCSSQGKIEDGFVCQTPGKACTPICGDGKLRGNEKCDDGNRKGGDGCSQSCTVEEGYYCKTPGKACELDRCGNGFVGPDEACDGQTGCGSDCKSVKNGYCYDKKNGGFKACSTTPKCGNYILEYGEACDDGNTLGGDGCSADCKKVEDYFECPNGVDCRPICGDGKVMWQLGEVCDLGADNGKGKGCSLKCQKESGFTCTDPGKVFPNSVKLPVVYRDFVGRNVSAGAGLVTDATYNELKNLADCTRKVPSGENQNFYKSHLPAGTSWLATGYGFPDFEGFAGDLCFGLVKDTLDSAGKPVFNGKITDNCCGAMTDAQCSAFLKGGTYNGASYPEYVGGTSVGWHHVSKLKKSHHVLCAGSLNKWFRTDSNINSAVSTTLELNKVAGSKYVFDSANAPYSGYFSPIDGKGLKDANGKDGHNGAFTTEITTTFQYKGGETLNFSGDDDVWVFINGKLFLDIGGMHAKVEGQNSLKTTTKSSADAKNGGTISRKYDSRYDLYENGIYELKVFHAERAASGADFKLTLDGFVNPSEVTCSSTCGDGQLAANEECDIKGHTNDDVAKKMGCVNCKWTTACGNGRVEGTEACDTGYLCNDNTYKAACTSLGLSYNANPKCNETKCAYNDNLCGNGKLDAGEQCDSKTDPLCNPNTCRWYCGNGILETDKGEECDLGANNNDNGNTGCTTKCKAAFCGDGVVSPFNGEVCDDGKNEGGYGEGKCMPGCMRKAPYCGDGVIQKDKGEECDLGKEKNTGAYGSCTSDCKRASYCGDKQIDTENGEQCDDGPAGSETCSSSCRTIIQIN